MATVNGLTTAELNRKLATPGAALTGVEFKQALSNFKSEIEAALPLHLKKNADKYIRQTMTLFRQNPELQKCTGTTILAALMTATGLGLDLTPALGQAYILPYANRKKTGGGWATVMEAAFQLGYRGAISLAQRSGEITRIAADVVYEKDRFKYSKGLRATLEHEESEEEDRGAIRYVYALAEFRNGGYVFDVWPVSKVIAHAKKFSKSYYRRDYKTGAQVENEKSPWFTNFESMAKKTLIMAIWKFLPLSPEIMIAGANDDTIKRDVDFTDMHDERDIITVIPEYGDGEGAEDAPDAAAAAAEEGAPESELDVLKRRVSDVIGAGGLDLTPPEQAEYLYRITKRKDISAMTAEELRAVYAEAKKQLDEKDGVSE